MESHSRKCELGYLQRADGSCLYSLGKTVVLASVNGPGDLRAQKQIYDRALIETNFQAKVGGSTISTYRNLDRFIRSICESCILIKQFPRSSIVITIEEMHDDGSLMASAINATCLALLDAGLPMRTVFAAVNCILALDDGNSEILIVDPDSKRENGNIKAKMIFVFESDGRLDSGETGNANGVQLSSCIVEGIISLDQLKMAQEAAGNAAKDIFRLYRNLIAKKCSKRMEFSDHSG